jgi:hypothetical protein
LDEPHRELRFSVKNGCEKGSKNLSISAPPGRR